jgi:hypothetical protein
MKRKKLPKELTTVTTLSKSVAIIVVITLPVIGFLLGMEYQRIKYTAERLIEQPEQLEPLKPEMGACTLDALICPDGSAVGRVPPKCEFSACPALPQN